MINEQIQRIDATIGNARGEPIPAHLLRGAVAPEDLQDALDSGAMALVSVAGLGLLRADLAAVRDLLLDVYPLAKSASCQHARPPRGRGSECCQWAVIVTRIEALGI